MAVPPTSHPAAPAPFADEGLTPAESRIQRGVERAHDEAAQLRLPEFFMFALLVVGTTLPRIGLPMAQVMVVVIVAYATIKHYEFVLGAWKWLAVLLGGMLLYLGLVSAFTDQPEEAADWKRRLFRLITMTFLAWFLATGRLHLRSALIGLVTALGINAVLFYAGLAPDTYGGYLTGVLGDKNYAGMIIAVVGVLALALFRTPFHRVLGVLVAAAMLWGTGSRTSLFAFAMSLLWMLLAPRISGFFRVILGGVIVVLTNWTTSEFATVGSFSNRGGSDALRERIDTAAWEKVTETGPLGRGLGNAYVQLVGSDHSETTTWFFHNSYWSAFVEGGWPWVLTVVGITIVVMIQPFRRLGDLTRYELIAQGAGVCLLIVGWRLGEVFYTLPWVLALGFALRARFLARDGVPEGRLDRYTNEDELQL